MNGLESLYQQIMIQHVKEPQARGLGTEPTSESHQLNPTCGDEVTVQLWLDDDRIARARWAGDGCMISQASASILAGQLTGLSVAEVHERIDSFRASMHSRGQVPVDEELLGDAVALAGAAKFVARVKCAMLPWVAVEDALAKVGH